ncbi:DUF5007 domain-containing protein [Mucilaginibacter myungsuensis]|uniref:DUF5007 domain-containing protein n=1 Tax=Mucilaginibacter myungsuensis TaxID=649104 RepID=A0A929PY87_9SPHI|nr:DUF5007 domain-containing protein [Mucilaginibacter myungsuensis]MBE9664638.1 DUF5007 domain-containing protein [Mucilaginibacter myungsuensis]MDN3601471.1 DUF5007 domain-containing protein [Mucilaginibacter myungsuensis]
MQNKIKYGALVLMATVFVASGCRKLYNLTDEKEYLSTQADYTRKTFDPILGRTNLYTNIFQPNGSSMPMKFEIRNPRFGDGRNASDMLAVKPTLVWQSEYTGLETSLAEIEAKRKLENHPMLELRPSGDLIFWYTATRDIIRPKDSISYPQNVRYIDVKISNSGGTRVIQNLTIEPRIDVPYEPADDYNQITGKPNTTTPGGRTRIFNYPSGLTGFKGESTNQPMDDPRNAAKGLVYVYIRKFDPDPNGHTLRFKFLNRDSLPINPGKFNQTKWIQQVHGFNAAGTALGYTQTAEYVEYNVAYPIPLARIPTKYTTGGPTNYSGGDRAHVEFSYSRIGFGNVRETATLSQDFKIFEKGNWEIVFHFKTVNPKFDND